MDYFCIDMTKIFTIGFSGKSPEAFLDVLNAARISCVWDIRQWRTSAYVPYYNGDNLAKVLSNRYEYHPEFAPTSAILAIQSVKSSKFKRKTCPASINSSVQFCVFIGTARKISYGNFFRLVKIPTSLKFLCSPTPIIKIRFIFAVSECLIY